MENKSIYTQKELFLLKNYDEAQNFYDVKNKENLCLDKCGMNDDCMKNCFHKVNLAFSVLRDYIQNTKIQEISSNRKI